MKFVREYLSDMLTEIEKLEGFVSEGEEAFYADDRTQYAVMMAYARIGEIAKRLPQELLDTQPQAQWREVKAFRDVLLHRYDEIALGKVWEAVEKLPTLHNAVDLLLANLPADEDEDAAE